MFTSSYRPDISYRNLLTSEPQNLPMVIQASRRGRCRRWNSQCGTLEPTHCTPHGMPGTGPATVSLAPTSSHMLAAQLPSQKCELRRSCKSKETAQVFGATTVAPHSWPHSLPKVMRVMIPPRRRRRVWGRFASSSATSRPRRAGVETCRRCSADRERQVPWPWLVTSVCATAARSCRCLQPSH